MADYFIIPDRYCPKCGHTKSQTTDNFYPARPTKTHPKGGWQSYCKTCWRNINRLNKKRIRNGA